MTVGDGIALAGLFIALMGILIPIIYKAGKKNGYIDRKEFEQFALRIEEKIEDKFDNLKLLIQQSVDRY